MGSTEAGMPQLESHEVQLALTGGRCRRDEDDEATRIGAANAIREPTDTAKDPNAIMHRRFREIYMEGHGTLPLQMGCRRGPGRV